MTKNVKKPLKNINIYVSSALDNKYTVSNKPLPANLPDSFKGKDLHWFSNFGFKFRANNAEPRHHLEETYDIELDKAGSMLVIFDGGNVQELEFRDSDTDPLKVKTTLDLGDPPLGWGTP